MRVQFLFILASIHFFSICNDVHQIHYKSFILPIAKNFHFQFIFSFNFEAAFHHFARCRWTKVYLLHAGLYVKNLCYRILLCMNNGLDVYTMFIFVTFSLYLNYLHAFSYGYTLSFSAASRE